MQCLTYFYSSSITLCNDFSNRIEAQCWSPWMGEKVWRYRASRIDETYNDKAPRKDKTQDDFRLIYTCKSPNTIKTYL